MGCTINGYETAADVKGVGYFHGSFNSLNKSVRAESTSNINNVTNDINFQLPPLPNNLLIRPLRHYQFDYTNIIVVSNIIPQ